MQDISCGDSILTVQHSPGRLRQAGNNHKLMFHCDQQDPEVLLRRRIPKSSEQASPSLNQLPRQEQGENTAMWHSRVSSAVRYTPYSNSIFKRRDRYHKGEQGNMERVRKGPDTGMQGNRQDGSAGRFAVTTVTKIKGVEGCQGAHDLPQEVHSDSEGVMHRATEMGLNGRKDTASSLQFLEENMPKLLAFTSSNSRRYQLVGLANMEQKHVTVQSRNRLANQMKAEGEMDTVKGLEPGEMSVGRKPLCTTSPDKPTDISDLLDLFPKVLSLDDPVLPPPLFSDIGNDKKSPFCKGSVFGSETLKDLVWKFLTQYYSIYDDGDRQGLLSAYHDNACFSLTTLFHTEDPSRISCGKSSKDSRAVKEFKDIGLCVLLVKRTKSEIVDFLSMLPKTQHDLSSFVVDVGAQMRTTLCFSVRGKFKERNMIKGVLNLIQKKCKPNYKRTRRVDTEQLLCFYPSNTKPYQLVGLSSIVQKNPSIKNRNLLEKKFSVSPFLLIFSPNPDLASSIYLPSHPGPCLQDLLTLSRASLAEALDTGYYWIYDNGHWQNPLDAYHDEACCTLTIDFNLKEPVLSMSQT
ncbi:nuclear RNA export factor 2-like [Echinops telfairi]|uniref:Nuclear RNA export factor 2-like n=1 Tax=Echinops telfairi TaxID=9371 RepID=A0AC55D442_ECHTE|nr:nuclear RNA export factor 2-like [Echinops telfairi]